MTPDGDHRPSTVRWLRDEAEHPERTGIGLRSRPVVLLRETPLMRVTHARADAVLAATAGSERNPDRYARPAPVRAVADTHAPS